MRNWMSSLFGWSLWALSGIIIALAVWYFWDGKTVYSWKIDKDEE